MKKELLKIMVFCAACLAFGAQVQNSAAEPSGPGSSAAGSPGSTSATDSQSAGSPSNPSARYSATGRMGQQEVRASKLMGSEIKSSSGETLGTISDVILNPSSGKVDFAVLSLSSTLGSTGNDSTSSTGTAGTSTSASSQSTSSGGKLAAVPWSLLRSSASAGYGASASASTSTSASGEQQSFIFTGEKTKLQNAPSFEESNWPQMNGSEWRRSIYSHYGVQAGYSSGAATSPGGVGSSSDSSSSSSSPSSTDSSSSSSSPSSSSSSTSPNSSSSDSSATSPNSSPSSTGKP